MTVRAAALLAALLLAGCAAAPPRTPQTRECRDYLDALDLQAAHAGVRDAGAARVPGYPYLRADRFTASLRDSLGDDARFARWLERLRQLDLQARGGELANLGLDDRAGLLAAVDRCGAALARAELAGGAARARLIEAVAVPGDYYWPARVLGLYPLAAPVLDLAIGRYHRQVEADYATPLDRLDSPGPLVRWDPPPAAPPPIEEVRGWLAQTDALGVPQLSPDQWHRLALAHAPAWWIERGGDDDLPGAPTLDGGEPGVDTGRPTTYFLPAYTRFGGKILVQLVYTIWFSRRPARDWFDPYAGALDGLVWRVTLDAEGQPLLYDTIHPCGCYRYFFPVWPAVRKPRGGLWRESALFPQADVPRSAPVALRVQAGTHYLRRVVAPAAARAPDVRRYQLAPYADLLSLPEGDGRRRSLFGEDGIVAGSQRGERFWLWVSGVPDPGAMRQWGRHATSFVGQSQFDDPDFLDRMFQVPR